MTARIWREGDPEPGRDVRAVVDEDGIIWARCRCNIDFDDDPPSRNWHQHLITIRGNLVLGGSIENEWCDVWGSLPEGSMLREATEEERRTWVQRREAVR